MHLRFGPVARGGLRWSDRPQDFRTEVLGLVKAQQVKNAVIVPVGAKGGFVPMRLPRRRARRRSSRPAGRPISASSTGCSRSPTTSTAARSCRRRTSSGTMPTTPISSSPPTRARRPSPTPPTAIALKRGFWLGDAFASGGSAGYDHKAMGITARGAWEAVKRHFREMDVDIQSQPFTVAGVGDMSGDVFGNGMLLSPCIKLVAAFDHRDIFIDPDPDPAAIAWRSAGGSSTLPRSSWQDYDRALISKGGGVFSRAEKQIALSPEAKKLLKLNKASARPAEILSAILKAPVDLLWFGGIGTYVRGPERDQRRCRRQGQRRDPHQRARDRREGGGGGRQPRHDAEGAHRLRAEGRALQFRRDRQFRRRQHLRRGGQHQDRARRRRCGAARLDAGRAPGAAALDDRRRRASSSSATTTSRRWRSRSKRGAGSTTSATSCG